MVSSFLKTFLLILWANIVLSVFLWSDRYIIKSYSVSQITYIYNGTRRSGNRMNQAKVKKKPNKYRIHEHSRYFFSVNHLYLLLTSNYLQAFWWLHKEILIKRLHITSWYLPHFCNTLWSIYVNIGTDPFHQPWWWYIFSNCHNLKLFSLLKQALSGDVLHTSTKQNFDLTIEFFLVL